MYNWIKDFLFERSIEVRVGKSLSSSYLVDNGTPQGSVISPLLFTIMINYVYSQVQPDIGRSIFADDGALSVPYIVRKVQEAIDEVERWALMSGFRFSVENSDRV